MVELSQREVLTNQMGHHVYTMGEGSKIASLDVIPEWPLPHQDDNSNCDKGVGRVEAVGKAANNGHGNSLDARNNRQVIWIQVLGDKMNRTVGFGNCFLRLLLVYCLPCCQGKQGDLSEKYLPNIIVQLILLPSI